MSARQTKKKLHWTKLSNIAETVLQPFINKHNDLILPICLPESSWVSQQKLSSIRRFVPIREEWTEIWRLENPMQMMCNAFAIDAENEIIYILAKTCLYTLELTKDKPNMQPIFIKGRNSDFYDSDTRCIVVKDQLHIFEFEDEEDFMHSIYDIKSGNYTTTTVLNDEEWDFDSHCMVHIPSQNRLLFVGTYFCGVVSYDINSHRLSEMEEFELSVNSIYDPISVLTNDEKYVLVLYFYRVRAKKKKKKIYYKNKIEILDIENNVKWISNVTMPFKSSSKLFAFILGNANESGMVINGFIRDCWKNKEFSRMNELPLELVGIILHFYHIEDLHLINNGKGEHWKKSLDDVLENPNWLQFFLRS